MEAKMKLKQSRSDWRLARYALVSLAMVVALAAMQPAHASILSLSATDFVLRCTPVCGGVPEPDPSAVDRGVLKPFGPGTYFSSVVLPNGENVCRFTLIYQDTNGTDGGEARLLRKRFKVGGNALAGPTVMASVTTAAGIVQQVRRAATTNITQPKIANGSSFYFVEIEVENLNVNPIGVQIDHRKTCP
jgi:hypothetical protein